MRPLKNILDEIDSILDHKLGYDITFHGLATLVTDSDGSKTYPVAHTPAGAYAITPNDTYPVQYYYRKIDSTPDVDTSLGFGASPASTLRTQMLLIGLVKHDESLDTEMYAINTYKALPVMLSGKEIINTTSIDHDTKAVLQREFDGINLNNLLLEVTAFSIEFQLNKRIC